MMKIVGSATDFLLSGALIPWSLGTLTGEVSQLSVVEMSWGKKSKKKPNV